MTDLCPTKTRLALLREVQAERVQHEPAQWAGGGTQERPRLRNRKLHDERDIIGYPPRQLSSGALSDGVLSDRHGQVVTTAIAEMQRAGWVSSLPADSRKCWRWRLTDVGRAVLDAHPET